MKVIYDVSILGLSQIYMGARTGIFRAVENLLFGLIASGECDLLFHMGSAPDIWGGFQDYLNNNIELDEIPIINRNYLRFNHRLFNKVSIQAPLFREVLQNLDRNQNFRDLMLWGRFRRRLFNISRSISDKYLEKSSYSVLRQADIFHSPYFSIPPILTGRNKLQRFLTIYDIIPIRYPEYVTKNYEQYFKKFIYSIDQELWILCISEFTKNDLLDLLKLDPSRINVVYLAASPELFFPCHEYEQQAIIRVKYKIPNGKYIISINSLRPHKNVQLLINAFAELVLVQKIDDLALVLVGEKGWRSDLVNDVLNKFPEIQDKIVITGFIDDQDLAAIYSGALAFVFPSIYEGFGLPVLEAMQCGVPVITSNTSSLPEIVGDAGVMIEPTDLNGLCQNLLEIYNDINYRETLSLRGLERSKQFSWENTTRKTLDAYKQSMGI